MMLSKQLVLSLLSIICFVVISGCSVLQQSLEPLEVDVVKVRVLPANGMQQRFLLNLQVSNPNGVDLPIEGVSYALSLNGSSVLKGMTGEVPLIRAYSSTELELEARTHLLGIVQLVNTVLRDPGQQFSYELDATIDFANWIPSMNVTRKGDLPMVR
ncbi:LEA type 2 family protein [Marinibactrum halimedae]|uniref:Water stress and hypersensitive response domain-containing protein n=1 Tax=Marinibactrum halimedae TaxID=1444977 RepID=A0AA37WKC8_9GAMM|nr:LEA type 2 family protein [Marinibactrum halimedae]MCD9457813.1 LEA type 2 family protein [Marinibactrum halimedae]GLS24813.1 hypothetical protein GCM10007877_05270 [Marinibactrum halimedae]